MTASRRTAATVLGALMMALLVGQATAADLSGWLDRIGSEDAKVRSEAWPEAVQYGAAAIGPLGKLMAAGREGTGIPAARAMELIVYSVSGPGMDAPRAATGRELCGLVDLPAPPTVKAQWLRMLGYVGDDDAVPVLAKHLLHPTLGGDFRQTLQRVPGHAATNALLATLKAAPDSAKPALIQSLATRGDRAALGTIRRLATSASPAVARSAWVALGTLDDNPGLVGWLAGTLQLPDAASRDAGADAMLATAARLERARLALGARAAYEAVLTADVGTGRHVAAVEGLRRVNDPAALPALLHGLGDQDPVFQAAAMDLVDEWAGVNAMALMQEAYQTAQPRAKAGLMLGMASRDDGMVAPILMEALGAEEEVVQAGAATGLGIIGHQPAEGALMKLAETGRGEAKHAALGSALVLLAAQLAEEKTPELLPKLNHALQIAERDEERVVALKAVGAYGDPSSLALIEPLTLSEKTREAALEAYVGVGKTLAESGEDEKAIGIFKGAVERGASRGLAEECVRQLAALGVDYDLARAAGFITEWWMVDDFPNKDHKGFDAAYPPEKGVDVTKAFDFEGRSRKWERHGTTDVQGLVDLANLFKPSNDRVAYAFAVVAVDSDREVTLKIGSDDAVKVWVNGEEVHSNHTHRPVRVDEDTATATLKAGENRILVKVAQASGGWGFCVRLVDKDGKALKWERVSPE